MRDEQIRRYARHILLPDVGGHGQLALLASTACIDLGRDDAAAFVAASYLAAGGVGTLVTSGAGDAQLARLASLGADTKLTAECGAARSEVIVEAEPAWWPSCDGDATALAFWRGGIGATRWMADVANQ